MVITPFLPVSQGDYILPAQNQMINDYAEQAEQTGMGGGGSSSSPVQGDLFVLGCMIQNPYLL